MGQITIDEMHKSLFDYAQAVSDENLITESKTVVGAINEIYGKRLIANAIGEPLKSTDTYAKMNDDINELLTTFKTNMMNSGVTVENGDKFKALIDKIKGLTEGEGNKGLQYAEGTYEDFTLWLTTSGSSVEVPCELNFTPALIFVKFDRINNTKGTTITNAVISNKGSSRFYMNYGLSCGIENISSNSFSMIFSYGDNSNITFTGVTWYLIGVGEEDTTLRDSLASVLEDEGVEVLEEDTMADLIVKTDEEFDRKNANRSKDIITASSLPSTVVNGQVVLIPKVETTLPIVLVNKFHMKSSTETEICVSTTETMNNFTFNPTLSNIKISYYLNNATQYSGGKNNPIDGYLGVNGVWSQFSKSGIIFYLNGVDSENISGASSSNNNSIYTGYYINTVNSGDMLNINTNVMGSTVSAYVCFKKAYDLTNYSKLEITYVKDSTYAPRFSFGFSKNYNYDKVSLAKSVRVDDSSPASGTVSVDVSSLTGVYYFAITGIGSTSVQYKLNVSSIILT